MITHEDLLTLIPGRRVLVTSCEANHHGDNGGCVCALKGKTVVMGERFQTPFVGTPSWHLKDHAKTVRLSEVTLMHTGKRRAG